MSKCLIYLFLLNVSFWFTPENIRKPLVFLMFSRGGSKGNTENEMCKVKQKWKWINFFLFDRCQGFITDLEQVLAQWDITSLLESYFSTYPLYSANNLKVLKAFLPDSVYHTQQWQLASLCNTLVLNYDTVLIWLRNNIYEKCTA